MLTEYNEQVLEYCILGNGEYVVKLKQHDGLECET